MINKNQITNQVKLEWLSFVSALGLLTRIPIGWFLRFSNEEMNAEHHNRAQIWYPAIGVIIGLILISSHELLTSLTQPFLYAVLLTTIWVCITGALHLDGLADSIDAYVGGMGATQKTRRQKTLLIMKDPTSGPMAVVGLVLLLLLKVALLTELIFQLWLPHQLVESSYIFSSGSSVFLFLLAPMLARAWLLPLLWKTPYARSTHTNENETAQGGMATAISSGFPFIGAAISFGFCQLIALVISLCSNTGVISWLLINITSALLFFTIRKVSYARINGYTGDVLGAFIELQEILILFILVLVISF